jgi:transposase
MISLPAGARIWVAAGVTDLRRGFTGLSAVAQTVLQQDPFGGHVVVFGGAAAILSSCCGGMAMVFVFFLSGWSVDAFVWPQAESGTISLTQAQLSMLLEGIDWRRPARTWKPEMAV